MSIEKAEFIKAEAIHFALIRADGLGARTSGTGGRGG